jgi:hypothetical protein
MGGQGRRPSGDFSVGLGWGVGGRRVESRERRGGVKSCQETTGRTMREEAEQQN